MKRMCMLYAAGLALFATACSSDDDAVNQVEPGLEEVEVRDLDASAEGGAYFSLSEGAEVGEDEAWDLHFANGSGTTLSVGNGAGFQLVELSGGTTFETYGEAPAEGYGTEDIQGSGSWYNYTMNDRPEHAILPVPGKIILVNTQDNNYAKIEVISYYKGNPDTASDEFADPESRPDARYYTFRYVLQPDGSRNLE